MTTIFSPKASLPALAAARLQRWAIALSAYHYDIEFHPTAKHANAHSLLRLTLDSISTAEIDNLACLFNIQQIATLPVDPKQLCLETSNDSVLSRVLRYTKEGWPQDMNAELRPFFRCKLEITIESGCLMWGIKLKSFFLISCRVEYWKNSIQATLELYE